jgi:hypothetical protein
MDKATLAKWLIGDPSEPYFEATTELRAEAHTEASLGLPWRCSYLQFTLTTAMLGRRGRGST